MVGRPAATAPVGTGAGRGGVSKTQTARAEDQRRRRQDLAADGHVAVEAHGGRQVVEGLLAEAQANVGDGRGPVDGPGRKPAVQTRHHQRSGPDHGPEFRPEILNRELHRHVVEEDLTGGSRGTSRRRQRRAETHRQGEVRQTERHQLSRESLVGQAEEEAGTVRQRTKCENSLSWDVVALQQAHEVGQVERSLCDHGDRR